MLLEKQVLYGILTHYDVNSEEMANSAEFARQIVASRAGTS